MQPVDDEDDVPFAARELEQTREFPREFGIVVDGGRAIELKVRRQLCHEPPQHVTHERRLPRTADRVPEHKLVVERRLVRAARERLRATCEPVGEQSALARARVAEQHKRHPRLVHVGIRAELVERVQQRILRHVHVFLRGAARA